MTEILTGLAKNLHADNLLPHHILIHAIKHAKDNNLPLISYLVKHSILSSNQILSNCVKYSGLEVANIDMNHLDTYAINLLNNDLIKTFQVIPLKKENELLFIGISDPTNQHALDSIMFYTGLRVQPYLVLEDELQKFIRFWCDTFTGTIHSTLLKQLELNDTTPLIYDNNINSDEPLIQFVNNIIQKGLEQSASDIHIESHDNHCKIRYRRDGILSTFTELPLPLLNRITIRLKVMAQLDTSERRLPQDGRFTFDRMDVRINICPTFFGEKIVLRLLNINKEILNINNLGFNNQQKNIFLHFINQPQGIILVSGPTGCGKTVTLYSALNHLNSEHKNILTVEDPIEIQLPGINQVNINNKIGLTFATALRTFLRQDPDIIMVGEIRDAETAKIAMQAAQTGHLVLSTLHTNSAFETLNRLKSMGIALYDIVSALPLIISQRLIRKQCPHCQKSCSPSQIPTSCQFCVQGYLGRTAIYELLPLSEKMATLILENAPTKKLLKEALCNNFQSLRQSGLEKISAGITNLNEINRVLFNEF